MTKLRWTVIVLMIGMSLALAIPASAHAILQKADPAENSTLQRAPAQISLYFSEPTQAGLSSIQVLDSRGNRVDAGDSRVDPADATHLTVSLGSLNNGVYTVAWTATSAADGHATTGSYPFAIGDAAALANAPKASQQAPLSPVEIILKGLLYLSGAALLGGLLFSQLVWQPSESIGNLLPAVQWRYRLGTLRLFLIALFLFEVASFAGIFAIAFQAGGFFSLYNLIFNTRAGCLVLARLGLGIGLAGLLFSRPAAWKTWGGLALGLLALLSISLGSHAVAEVHPVFPVLADWIHLSATSVWIGGLFFFLIALWSYRLLPPAQRTQRLSGMIPRFSNLALVSVGSLALTGLYEAILRVGTLQALVSTTYGQALILKTLIFLPIVGLGALNLLVITPRMQQAASQPEGNLQLTQRFNRSVTAEASLGIVILLWVGLFTSLPPAQTNSAPPGFNRSTTSADLKITLNIQPAKVGINTFTVNITSGGKVVPDIQMVKLEISSFKGLVPPTQVDLAATGNGNYTLKGGYMNLPDNWEVDVRVIRPTHGDTFGKFQVNLSGAPAATTPWHQVAALILLLTAFLAGAALLLSSAKPRSRIVDALLISFVFIAGSVYVYLHTPAASSDAINPITPSTISIETGQAIYMDKCSSCHGMTGKGDGPTGLILNPRPADLSIHAIPGVHTDGQLYAWITNGYPNSAMPGFKAILTDEQRWDLVNFIRTLAPKS